MTLYDFIFSDAKKSKLKRHLAFWTLGCLILFYYDLNFNKLADLLTQRPYIFAGYNLVIYVPLTILTVAVSMEVLVPKFLQRKNYAGFVLSAFIVILLNVVALYFLAGFYMDYIFPIESGQPTGDFKPHAVVIIVTTRTFLNITLAFAGTAIKLMKVIYLQQVENTRLAKEKSENEIRLAKGRIQPGFLLDALAVVYKKVSRMEPDATKTVLHLSDILSYILYDADENLIPLSKELEMTFSLVDLENFNRDNRYVRIVEIEGNADNKSIRPLVLFTCIRQILNTPYFPDTDPVNFPIQLLIKDDYISLRLPQNILEKIKTTFLTIEESAMPGKANKEDYQEKELRISIVNMRAA